MVTRLVALDWWPTPAAAWARVLVWLALGANVGRVGKGANLGIRLVLVTMEIWAGVVAMARVCLLSLLANLVAEKKAHGHCMHIRITICSMHEIV